MVLIFNGRVDEDHRVGKARIVQNTVVDHVIGSPLLFSRVINFSIMGFDPLLLDVLCGITLTLEVAGACHTDKQ